MPRNNIFQLRLGVLILLSLLSVGPAVYGQSAADQYSIAAGFYSEVSGTRRLTDSKC